MNDFHDAWSTYFLLLFPHLLLLLFLLFLLFPLFPLFLSLLSRLLFLIILLLLTFVQITLLLCLLLLVLLFLFMFSLTGSSSLWKHIRRIFFILSLFIFNVLNKKFIIHRGKWLASFSPFFNNYIIWIWFTTYQSFIPFFAPIYDLWNPDTNINNQHNGTDNYWEP